MKLSFYDASIGRRIVSLLLALSFIASPFVAFVPQRAEAATSCIGSIVGGYLSGIIGSREVPTADTKLNFVECVLKPLAIAMARTLVRNIGTSIVNWVNSGFEGNPAFVTDFEGALRDAADEEIGRFIEGSELGWLCEGFQFQVRLALATKYSQRFQDRATCTLSDIGDNIEAFVDNNGGLSWDQWLSLTTEPQNNIYGAYFIAQNELAQRAANAVTNKKDRIILADGFLDYVTCDDSIPENETAGIGEDILESLERGVQSHYQNRTPTPFGTIQSDLIQTNPNSKYRPIGTPKGHICLHASTKTPGKFIESQLSATAGSWALEIGLATEIDQVIGALVNKLAQDALTGAGGLLGLTKKNASASTLSYADTLRIRNDATDPSNQALDTAIGETVGNETSANNIAFQATARSSSAGSGIPQYATDGNTDADGEYSFPATTAGNEQNPWIEVDLGSTQTVQEIRIWKATTLPARDALETVTVSILDAFGNVVWRSAPQIPGDGEPNPLSFQAFQSGQIVRVEKRASPRSNCGIGTGAGCYYPLEIAEIEVISIPQDPSSPIEP